MAVTKIYFEHPKEGSLRRLDKSSKLLYEFLIDYFLNNGGNQEYLELNIGQENYKPLEIAIPVSLEPELKSIIGPKGKSLSTHYGLFERPLAVLSYKVKFKNSKAEQS